MNRKYQKEIISKSERESYELANEFCKILKGGDVVELDGDLGAGKTTFSKAIAKSLGIKKNVTSPTFVVMKVYDVVDHSSIKYLCHIDAYRVSDNDLESIGALEHIGNKDALCLIEWGSNIPKSLPEERIKVKMSHVSENERKIKIN